MVEPVTDVEALSARHDAVADQLEESYRRSGVDSPVWADAIQAHRETATALRTLQERCKELEAGVAQLSDQNDKLQDLIPPLPDGLVAVPLEPTEEMEDAGRYRDAKEGESIYAAIYRAMLSARPTQAAGD